VDKPFILRLAGVNFANTEQRTERRRVRRKEADSSNAAGYIIILTIQMFSSAPGQSGTHPVATIPITGAGIYLLQYICGPALISTINSGR
jgi:hypothetical protein